MRPWAEAELTREKLGQDSVVEHAAFMIALAVSDQSLSDSILTKLNYKFC